MVFPVLLMLREVLPRDHPEEIKSNVSGGRSTPRDRASPEKKNNIDDGVDSVVCGSRVQGRGRARVPHYPLMAAVIATSRREISPGRLGVGEGESGERDRMGDHGVDRFKE